MDGVLRTHGRRRVLLFGLGLLGTLSVIAGGMMSTLPSADSGPKVGGVGTVQHMPPLGGGTQVSLNQAITMTGVQALLPQTTLAPNASISGVWARSQPPDMLVFYKSGVAAEVRPWSLSVTPDQHWNALMSEGLPGAILAVDGQDMYVIPPGGQASVGSVNFVTQGGIWVSIYGDGTYSASQLQDLATSTTSTSP